MTADLVSVSVHSQFPHLHGFTPSPGEPQSALASIEHQSVPLLSTFVHSLYVTPSYVNGNAHSDPSGASWPAVPTVLQIVTVQESGNVVGYLDLSHDPHVPPTPSAHTRHSSHGVHVVPSQNNASELQSACDVHCAYVGAGVGLGLGFNVLDANVVGGFVGKEVGADVGDKVDVVGDAVGALVGVDVTSVGEGVGNGVGEVEGVSLHSQ